MLLGRGCSEEVGGEKERRPGKNALQTAKALRLKLDVCPRNSKNMSVAGQTEDGVVGLAQHAREPDCAQQACSSCACRVRPWRGCEATHWSI